MLNIDKEPIASPITKWPRTKKLKLTSGASARASTESSKTNAAAANRSAPTRGSRGGSARVRHFMQPEDQRHHERGQQNKADPVYAPASRTIGTHGRRACGGHTGKGD